MNFAAGPALSVLAIVPARAGSKSIPRKNMCRIGGHTLIGLACMVARTCESIGRVVITSDDDEMGGEGLSNGAELFIKRPAELATDEATAADVWRHAWVTAERDFNERFEAAVWLQPTSPTRTVEDIEATMDRLATTDASAVVTVSPVPKHFAPQKLVTITDHGRISPLLAGSTPNVRRQDVPVNYWLNGHCYAARREPFLSNGVIIPDDAVAVVIARAVANIDDPEDLELARVLMSERRQP